MTERAKKKIDQAAMVSHQTREGRNGPVRASDEALKHHQAIRVTNRDRDLFLAALDAAERSNPAFA